MADLVGELEVPDGDDVAPAFALTVQHVTRLATGIVVSQLGLLAFAAAMSHSRNDGHWGFVVFLPSLFLALLAWAATLDRRCTVWPLRVSVVIASATFIQGNFTVVHGKSNNHGGEIAALLGGILGSLVYIKTFQICRRCLQAQYPKGDKMLEASRKVFLHILGTGPILLVFTLNCANGLSQFVAANEEYAAHTPLCSHTPHNRGRYNTAYSCNAPELYGMTVDRVNHIRGHSTLGIASLPLYLGVDTHLNFTEAVALGEAALAQPPTTNVTAELMHNDFVRLTAVRDYDEAWIAYLVAVFQGTILLLTVFVSLVLARGARFSTNDVLLWRVAKAELVAVACTAINVMLVLLLGSLGGKERASSINVIQTLIVAVVFVQLGCLHKTCHDIVREKHVHVSTRAPRASAVVPQASPRGSDEGGEGPGSETSPATPASIDPSADWGAAFAKMAIAINELDEKHEHAMREQNAKHERAIQAQDQKCKQELAKQKQDYEQKLVALRGILEEYSKASGSFQHQTVRSSEL
jgi:hypothetical protein